MLEESNDEDEKIHSDYLGVGLRRLYAAVQHSLDGCCPVGSEAARRGARLRFFLSAEERVVLVTSVRDGSPAEKAGMLAADRIFKINGSRIEGSSSLYKVYFQHQPGDTVQFMIERSGQTAPVFLTAVFRPRPLGSSSGLIEFFAEQVNDSFPVPFLIVGLTVLFLRLEDRNAWLLALLFASFTAAPSFPKELPVAQALRPFALVYKTIFLSMLGPLFYCFFAVFPVRSPLDRRLPWLKWVSMMGRGKRLVGLFVLGPRLSDETYSGEDKHLLSSVAIQAATAFENMCLAEEIAERKKSERFSEKRLQSRPPKSSAIYGKPAKCGQTATQSLMIRRCW